MDFLYTAVGVYQPQHLGVMQFYGAAAEAQSERAAADETKRRMAAVEATLTNYPLSRLQAPDGQWWWYLVPGGRRLDFSVSIAEPTMTVTPTATPIATLEPPTATDTPTHTPVPPAATPIDTPIMTPTLTPDADDFCSISVANGHIFTNRLDVTLVMKAPGATEVLVTNDGGFDSTVWQPFQPAMSWTLRDPGTKIITLLVQARFRDGAGKPACNGDTIFDDIAYDPLPPTVAIDGFTADVVAAQEQSATINGVLRLTAADQAEGSGLAEMQISDSSTFSNAIWQPFAATVAVTAVAGSPIYVRVRDGAGNLSQPVSISVTENRALYLPLVIR